MPHRVSLPASIAISAIFAISAFNMAMSSLGNILRNKSAASPLLKGVNASMAVEAANAALIKFFGPDIVHHATAAYVKDNVLFIACLSSVAAQEIKMQEKSLINATNEALPLSSIKSVKYIS